MYELAKVSKENKGQNEFVIPKKYLRRVVMMLMIQGSEGMKPEDEENIFRGVFVFMVFSSGDVVHAVRWGIPKNAA